ncbi:hypothetical protein [Brasilonema sp. UFV-L1]|uniref:hypothetical protein n=1 Tax=Brasilonema sp. UFV-L1 TaxID=2234130 RepID=UPI00145D94B0|nr:hypothetical protein [Brasilonema sp. UFV-L1]
MIKPFDNPVMVGYLLEGVADLKYESSFVMLNVAKRNEASAEILCPADTLR